MAGRSKAEIGDVYYGAGASEKASQVLGVFTDIALGTAISKATDQVKNIKEVSDFLMRIYPDTVKGSTSGISKAGKKVHKSFQAKNRLKELRLVEQVKEEIASKKFNYLEAKETLSRNISDKITEVNEIKDSLKTTRDLEAYKPLKEIDRQIKQKQLSSRDAIKSVNEEYNNTLNATRATIKQNIDDIHSVIDVAAEIGASDVKGYLPKWFRANSKLYGQRLDEISEAISNNPNQKLLKGDMNGVLEKTLTEAREMELPEGKIDKVITDLIQTKYGTTNFSKEFTLKDIVNDVRKVRNAIPKEIQRGSRRLGEEEVVISLLNKNWGELVGTKIPELKQLNTEYKPVIEKA